MEEWQIEHITKNLPELASLTVFNSLVKSKLVANNILSHADVERLDMDKNDHIRTSRLCYQMLMGRTRAYEVLVKALIQHNQSGAARILVRGTADLFSQPLTLLNISMNCENFQDVSIEVHGKIFKIKEFFPTVCPKMLQEIFQDTISQLDFYETFLTKYRMFVLSSNTIPPKPPFYVTRFLSNQIILDQSIFKADIPDVFVFKNNIARYKVSEIASAHFTASSSSQLPCITSRFIYLDDNEDWTDLKLSAKIPIHLIKFEVNENMFLLEDTSVASDNLWKFGSRKSRVYKSEDEFVQQQLSEDYKSCVCICDTAGMGKSFLLANIAHTLVTYSTCRIIAYIPLIAFTKHFFSSRLLNTTESEPVLLIFRYITSSDENAELLFKLLKAEIIHVDIFFDGFDEILPEENHWMTQVLLSITFKFPEVRIYITSRPHMRKHLEDTLGVVAYDILPFNQQSQIDFLVQFWSTSELNADLVSLKKYATICLESFNSSLTTDSKEMTGIPLFLQLVAVTAHVPTKRRNRGFSINLFSMYQKFIKMRINKVSKSSEEFEKIKLVHMWHALKQVFPSNSFHDDIQFKNVELWLTLSGLLNIGIVEEHPNVKLQFIHRAFAEYFAAEYFFLKLQNTTPQEKNCKILSMLKVLLQSDKQPNVTCSDMKTRNTNYNFTYPLIVSFMDSMIAGTTFSKVTTDKIAIFLTCTSPNKLTIILCACCQHNFCNIFTILKDAMMKCDSDWVGNYFKPETNLELLSVCVEKATPHMFHNFIQFLTEVLRIDVAEMAPLNDMLELAVKSANYEAVEYLVGRVSSINPTTLKRCLDRSYNDDSRITIRENILQLLLQNDPSLIHKTPDILVTEDAHFKLIKILVKFGANLTAVGKNLLNVVTSAVYYMSPTHYHELCQFLVTECKAEHLFLQNEKWIDPLPIIIEKATLLPETMELIFNIPGINMSKNDLYGNVLLFSAAKGNKLVNLQQLVNYGLDYNAKGKGGESLLHVAACVGDVEMIQYLLSLKLDPNYRDQDYETSLQKAVKYNERLGVIKILLENGANVHAINDKGQTCLHLFANKMGYSETSSKDITLHLLENGVGLNDRDIDGNTPLHLCQDEEVRKLLVEMGADIHAKNKKGQVAAQIMQKM